jgi:predicted component of type VI protein secretion system
LAKNGVSWGYYTEPGDTNVDPDDGSTPLIWNPLSLFTTVQIDQQQSNIQDASNFFAAAANGTLPSVSWVMPNIQSSEHSPGDLSNGQAWVTSIVNAVMASPEWDSSAIFLSWDDWGGFYDHVVPPQIDANGYGLRVPGLVISPYAKQGMIDSQTLSTDGYLKFIEDDFLNGQRINPQTDGRADNRPDVRENAPQLGDLVNDFDFSQAPRAPVFLPLYPVAINAVAGGPYTIQEGQSLTLDGSGTTNPTGLKLNYVWDVSGARNFNSAGGVNPTLSWSQLQSDGIANDPGTYLVRLKVFNSTMTIVKVSEETFLTVTAVPPTATISGAAQTALGESYTLNLSAAFTGDPDGDTVSGWTITWGDGSTSTVNGNPPTVTHTYTEAGSFTVTAAAQDDDGAHAAGNTVAVTVTGSPLSLTFPAFAATENAAFSGIVATFTDAAGSEPATNFTGTITWGDGHVSPALLTAKSGGGFNLSGSHTYAEEGTYTVSLILKDIDGASAGASSLVIIGDAALQLTAESLSALPNEALNAVVAAFRDPGGDGTVADYSATIAWGDGQMSQGMIDSDGNGGFNVWGGHTYTTTGTFHAVVTVTDVGGASGPVTSVVLVADTGLAGTAETVKPTEGAAFSGVVAAFRDPDGNTVATGYTATIAWGDGQSGPGTIAADGSGGFTVTAGHTYAEEGTFNPVVTIQDSDGTSTVVTSTALVADASLTGSVESLQATENTAFSGVVAAFRDPGGDGTANDYTASIAWGDGKTSTGTITADDDGGWLVNGTHTYAEEGNFSPVVTITDAGGASTKVTSTMVVADAALAATAATFGAAPNTAFNGEVASFTDPGTDGTTKDYTATIAWGDGQSSGGTVTLGSSGGFLVSGSHTYTQVGLYHPVITINDVGGASTQVTGSALVSQGGLQGTAETVQATENIALNGTVAAFRDPDGNTAASAYTATITWGDGQSSTGTVVPDGSGGFTVTASHAYAEEGTYNPGIAIQDTDGAGALVTSTVVVSDAKLAPSAVNATGSENATFSGTVAAFQDPGTDSTTKDYTATIAWGDGQSSSGTIAPNGSGFIVTGSHLYTEEGIYNPVVTINDAGGASAKVTSTIFVADASLQATSQNVITTAGTAFSGGVADFTDPGSDGTTKDYTATIAWGDGQTSPGTVTSNTAGGFTVTGGNTYAAEGRYTVTVTITDVGSATATVTDLAHVARVGPPPTGLMTVSSTLVHSAEYYGDFVTAAYQKYLGRTPSSAEVALWVSLMQQGLSDEHVEAGFIGSQEYIADHGGLGAGWITAMYQNLLGRDPSPAEVNSWVQLLVAGASPTEIAFDFAASPEREGQRITADYEKYLGRAPSQAEVKAWVTLFENGYSNENVIAGFAGSPEYFTAHFDNITDFVYSDYQDILNRQPTAAELAGWVAFLKNH